MKLSAAFKASIALSSAMCPMLTNSSRVLRESRTIQIIDPICSTAGSPISITNETMPGFLTTSLPDDVKVTLLADRGFADTKLFGFLDELGFDYVIRLKGNTKVSAADGPTRPA